VQNREPWLQSCDQERPILISEEWLVDRESNSKSMTTHPMANVRQSEAGARAVTGI
jgi:hypothetical protein